MKKDITIINDINNENTSVQNLIYEIRGRQVMLDSDLAKLYECKNGTKTINLAVKRHINRFPERFMFQLTKEEYYGILRFQNETLELQQGQYSKYLPYAFTEQGVAMLATVIRSSVAEEISIKIMDAFVAMKKYISSSLIEQKYFNNLVIENHNRIDKLEKTFQKFEEKKVFNEVYFNGQIYDAYSKILDIFKESKKSLIIIDSYADKTILDIIKNLKVNVTIITKPNNLLHNLDIKKYNEQYNNLLAIYDKSFHDRYFIIDNKKIYHCGTSLNKIGSKTFSITLMNDLDVCMSLIKRVKEIIKSKEIEL